jgi:single-strand DNA-binding protein
LFTSPLHLWWGGRHNLPYTMNHVNLIGKISSAPKVVELENGKRIAQFTLSTTEMYLDDKGNQKKKSYWHRLTAWGKWVSILDQHCEQGMQLAIEGKLVSRFYREGQQRKYVFEVEVNDLTIL